MPTTTESPSFLLLILMVADLSFWLRYNLYVNLILNTC